MAKLKTQLPPETFLEYQTNLNEDKNRDSKRGFGRPSSGVNLFLSENIARIANAVTITLYSKVTMQVHIVVLNCQKCNQCLKCQVSGHKNFQKI